MTKFEDVEIDGQKFDEFIDERIQKSIGTPIEEQIRESTEQMRKDHFEFLEKTEKEKRETVAQAERKAARQSLMAPGWSDEKRAMFTGIKAAAFLVLAQKAFIEGRPIKEMADHAKKAGMPRVAKALSVSVSEAGGILIPEEFSSDFIGAVYKTMAMMKLGTRTIKMPRGGKLAFGKLIQSATFSWIGELENAVVSEQRFGKEELAVKKGSVMVPVSNDFLRREFAGMEQIIVDDMMSVTGVGVETGFWRGDGTGNNPLGIANQMNGGIDGGQAVAASGNALADVEDDYIDMQFRVLNHLNANTAKSPGFAVPLSEKQHLMKLRTADGYPVYRDEIARGQFMGVPLEVAGCLPTTLGAGSNETESYFADFAEVLVGSTFEATFDASKTASYTTGGQTYHTFQDDSTLMRVLVEKDVLLRRNKALARLKTINRSA